MKVNLMPPQPYWDQYIREREAQRQLAKKDAEEKRIKEVTRYPLSPPFLHLTVPLLRTREAKEGTGIRHDGSRQQESQSAPSGVARHTSGHCVRMGGGVDVSGEGAKGRKAVHSRKDGRPPS